MSRETELEKALLESMAREHALRQALGAADSAMLDAISALSHLPPDHGPIRRRAGECIATMRTARDAAINALELPAPPVVTLDTVRNEALRAIASRTGVADEKWRDGVASLADTLGANVDDALGDV